MKKVFPLMQREWMQHRFGWAWLALLPLALALFAVGFAQIEFSGEAAERVGEALPALLTLGSIVGSTFVVFMILSITSLMVVVSLARRDQPDRSIEFWLSLPVSHSQSLAVPLLVHLLLAPAVALLVGLLGGYVISLVLVGRFVGIAAWLSLPWMEMIIATSMVAARLLAGLPLAVLWLLPLVLLFVLASAVFKRWGVPVVALGLGLGAALLDRLLGQPWLSETVGTIGLNAATSLISASGKGFRIGHGQDVYEALQGLPAWAMSDFAAALHNLASPVFVGGLVFSALCFAGLVLWRQRGATQVV